MKDTLNIRFISMVDFVDAISHIQYLKKYYLLSSTVQDNDLSYHERNLTNYK